jgi:predicted metalloprotease with PDZ domain
LNLDDVLRAQRRLARRGGPTAAALFPGIVRRVAGIDIGRDLARFAERGEPLLLPGDIAPACVRVTSDTRHAFTRGFDIAATEAAAGTIRGVDPAGPAYAAGIRDGMKLVKREAGTIGDSAQEIAYRVSDAQGERVIRYLPAAKETFEVQQLKPNFGLTHEAELCHATLGGAFR